MTAARTLNWEHEEHELRQTYARLIGAAAPPVPPVVIPEPGEHPEITITVGTSSGVTAP